MKKVILSLLIGFMLIGCGSSTKEAIEDKVVDKIDKTVADKINDSIESPEDVIEVPEKVIEPEPIVDAVAKYVYENIPMYSQPLDAYGLNEDYGSYATYSVYNDSWDLGGIVATDEDGIVKIAFYSFYDDDDYGVHARIKYNEAKTDLDSKYTLDLEYDFCNGSDWMCGTDNYSYSIYTGDRYRLAYYIDGNNSIILSIGATGVYDTKVVLSYESAEFNELVE